MRYRSALTLICSLLGMVSIAGAQEVYERKAGVYESEAIKASQPLKPGSRIQIASTNKLSGEIKLVTDDTDSLRVLYVKVAKAASKSQAIDFIDLISVDIGGRPEAPVVKLRAPNPTPWEGTNYSGSVEVALVVPRDCEIVIDAQVYDVSAVGPFRSVEIPASLGRLEISDVNGKLNVATVNRRVSLENVTGDIEASTTNSSLIARSIVCLKEQARFRNEGGDIRIEGLTGSVNIRNSYGRVTVEGFDIRGENSSIRGASGPIFVEIVGMNDGQLSLSNRQEDIEINVPDTLAAYYTLSVGEEGVIEVSNFPFRADLIQRDRLSLQAGESDADIRGSIKGAGNIYVRGRAGGGDE